MQVQPCTLAFRLDDDAGSSRVLLYQRGDERVRWDLARELTPNRYREQQVRRRPRRATAKHVKR